MVHQEYPKMLYRGAMDTIGRIVVEQYTVQNADKEREAQAAGWVESPDDAVAVEKARQAAIVAARQEQEARIHAEAVCRMLDEREERRKNETVQQMLDAAGDAAAAPGTPVATGADRPAVEAEEAGRRAAEGETASFSQRLTALRKEARWTVEELADQVSLAKETVHDHLAGKTQPRLKNVDKYEGKFSERLKRPIKLDV